MPVSERDRFLIGERVQFDVDIFVANVQPPDLSGTIVLLTVKLPDGSETAPLVSVGPGSHCHAEFVTSLSGWHEWRWETTGTIVGAQQGRFRVVATNV